MANSGKRNGKLALALDEGKFIGQAALHITENKEASPPKPQGNLKVYDISLSGTDLQSGSTVTLRLLNENRSKITAWLLQDRRWEEIETHNRGKYVLLQSPTLKSTICLEYTKRPSPPSG